MNMNGPFYFSIVAEKEWKSYLQRELFVHYQ